MTQNINLQYIKDMLKIMSDKDKDDFMIGLYKVPSIKKHINERLGGIDLDEYYQQAIKVIYVIQLN